MHRITKLAFAALTAASLSTQAGTFSDLWWNPNESGWGMNVVQQEENAFVTLFLYGPNGEPRWYVASNAHVIGYVGSLPTFSGTLYRTQGPWHGGAFDPSQVRAVPVGTISLEARAVDRMRVWYQAEGVTVEKDVERQTWADPRAFGFYHGTFAMRQSVPGADIPAAFRYSGEIRLEIDGPAARMHVVDTVGRQCEYAGTYKRTGKLASIIGTFACSGASAYAASGAFELTDLEITEHGVTGHLRATAPNLTEYGRFGGARL